LNVDFCISVPLLLGSEGLFQFQNLGVHLFFAIFLAVREGVLHHAVDHLFVAEEFKLAVERGTLGETLLPDLFLG